MRSKLQKCPPTGKNFNRLNTQCLRLASELKALDKPVEKGIEEFKTLISMSEKLKSFESAFGDLNAIMQGFNAGFERANLPGFEEGEDETSSEEEISEEERLFHARHHRIMMFGTGASSSSTTTPAERNPKVTEVVEELEKTEHRY